VTSSLHDNSAFELASGFHQAPTNMGAIGYALLGEAFWAKWKNNACDLHGEAFWAKWKNNAHDSHGEAFEQETKSSNFNDTCCDRLDSLYPYSIA